MLLLTILIFTITGCNLSINSEVYVKDIIDVDSMKKPLLTPVVLKIPISSSNTEKCNENKNTLLPIIQKYHSLPITFKGCLKEGYDNYMNLELDTQVTNVNNKGNISYEGLFSIAVEDTKKDNQLKLFLAASAIDLKNLSRDIKNKTYQDPKLDEMIVYIKISNDTRSDVTGWFGPGFIDGNPEVSPSEKVLKRRDSVTIKLGDVQTAYLVKNGFITLGYMKK